jgi:hemoglobin
MELRDGMSRTPSTIRCFETFCHSGRNVVRALPSSQRGFRNWNLDCPLAGLIIGQGALFNMTTPAPTPNLYEQLGGKPAVDAAVDLFYQKVLADIRISHFFASIDMKKQMGKQKAFLTMVFGGPANYTGLDMRKGHAHLVERGLNDSHFDAVVENLGQTLAELGVNQDLIRQVAAIAESVRNDVLNR